MLGNIGLGTKKKNEYYLEQIELTWDGLGQFIYLFYGFFHDFLLPNL